MVYIEVPDENDSVSSVTLDDLEYQIRFTYNEVGDYWTFSILDNEDNTILGMTKIVPNFPLIYFVNKENLPNGIFGVVSDLQRVGREDFNNGYAEFVFIPNSELED